LPDRAEIRRQPIDHIKQLGHRSPRAYLTGSRSRIVHRPLPVDDPIQRCPDISQASALLGWKPRTQLRTGLQRTIAYFDGLLRESGDLASRESAAA
jgi:UDP-glucuronate decarboxylase